MTYEDISYLAPINVVDPEKVNELVNSMLINGYVGCPILVVGERLLTGSHRQAALKEIARRDMYDELDETPVVLGQEVAVDVTELVEARLAELEEENDHEENLEDYYYNLGALLTGTWIEKYKDEIAEW